MRKTLLITALLAAMLMLIVGCGSEADNPASPYTYDKGTIVPVADPFASAMNTTDPANPVTAYYYVYLPPGYNANRSTPYPVLYLLHGYGGNENYWTAFFHATDAMDQLIAKGDVPPYVLVLPNGKNAFGGSFYTNSAHPYVGTAEDHIMNIITAVEGNYNVASTPAEGKAIAGHSMGGFGAMSIALNHGGTFSAVSAMAAPLAFWGTEPASDTYKGIEELLPAVLLETGYAPGEGAAAYQEKMYPAPDRRVTSMMFAMAAAFSPTDPANPTSTSIAAYGVDLPLGQDGQLDMNTWNRWLANGDPLSRFANGAAANLAGVKVYLDAGLADDLGLYGAHQVFAGALAQAGMPAAVDTYFSGIVDHFGTIPAGHVQQTFERIKVLLKWNGDQF